MTLTLYSLQILQQITVSLICFQPGLCRQRTPVYHPGHTNNSQLITKAGTRLQPYSTSVVKIQTSAQVLVEQLPVLDAVILQVSGEDGSLLGSPRLHDHAQFWVLKFITS